jgi:hypothetical protein
MHTEINCMDYKNKEKCLREGKHPLDNRCDQYLFTNIPWTGLTLDTCFSHIKHQGQGIFMCFSILLFVGIFCGLTVTQYEIWNILVKI